MPTAGLAHGPSFRHDDNIQLATMPDRYSVADWPLALAVLLVGVMLLVQLA